MILYFSVGEPHRWVIIDRKDRVLEDGVAETLDHIPIRHRRITKRVGVVPGELVTLHSLRIPARSRAKAAAAAPYMIEESLASSVEDLEFRLLRWKRGGTSTVAVVARDALTRWHARLAEFPEPTDALIPDYLLLPRHSEVGYTVASDGGDRLIVRAGELAGLVIDEQELDLWWEDVGNPDAAVAVNHPHYAHHLIERGGRAVNEWQIGKDFPEWLRHGHQVPNDVNLLQRGSDDADGSGSRTWITIAGGLLALALVIRLGVDAYDYVTLAAKARDLNRQIEATLKQAFPEITRVVDPKVQMAQRVATLKGQVTGGSFLALLAMVAEAAPGAGRVVEIGFRDSDLLITYKTQDFEALDRLRKRFLRNPKIRVELLSSGSRDNSVSGRFRLSLRTG